MNKTNIKRIKALGLALLTTLALSACVEAPSDDSSKENKADYSSYVMITIDGVKCRIASKWMIANEGYTLYKLEDGTEITVSNATGELLYYSANSTVIEEAMREIEHQLDEPILTLD